MLSRVFLHYNFKNVTHFKYIKSLKSSYFNRFWRCFYKFIFCYLLPKIAHEIVYKNEFITFFKKEKSIGELKELDTPKRNYLIPLLEIDMKGK